MDITFSANEAAVAGGAILLEGNLGNNTLSLSGFNSFQGNNVRSASQDIAVSSPGTVTFDSASSIANIVGGSFRGFAWRPVVAPVQPNASASDSYPALLTQNDSWIVEAKQVRPLRYSSILCYTLYSHLVFIRPPLSPCSGDRIGEKPD
jgi:predicted outer membrane repeat protein